MNRAQAAAGFSPDLDPEGTVSLFQGDRMIINATGVAAANPGLSLRLVVDWGDGDSELPGKAPRP